MSRYFQDKKVVVTGAAGFIGSHLCESLIEAGAHVTGVDNFITGRKQNLSTLEDVERFKFITADVSVSPDTFLSPQVDCIFHFASPASPPGYQANPVQTYLVNSIGTHNILQYLVKNAPKARFLFASTSEAYGDPLEHPQKETYYGNVNPNGERSMYDEAKRFGEMVCGVHQRTFNIDTRIVRIFNTYGPRMDPHDGRSLVEFATRMLAGEKVVVFGDGKQTRSYCYVKDLVRGILSMMESDKTRGQTVNLGNPVELTMLELIDTIQKQLGIEAKIEHRQARSDDPKKRRPDISKAQSLLGWHPDVSIQEGLALTLSYFQQRST